MLSSFSCCTSAASGAAVVAKFMSFISSGNLLGVSSGPSGSGEEEDVEERPGEAEGEYDSISVSSGRGNSSCSSSEVLGVLVALLAERKSLALATATLKGAKKPSVFQTPDLSLV
jgi:hypothetical protein